MAKVFINISELYQTRDTSSPLLKGAAMAELPSVTKAYLKVSNGLIESFGPMDELTATPTDEVIDLKNRMVTPAFVDSHTHMVFAADRDEEFVMKIKGMNYQDIAQAGGGILNSARRLQETPLEDLLESAQQRVQEAILAGTGALEIKSGYGLSFEAELKMLQVIAQLKERMDIPIKATFLGAHAYPNADKGAYMDLLINDLLPEISNQGLADFIDCFCEEGYFSVEDMHRLLEAGHKHGLRPKVHVNQFNAIGGIEKAIAFGALSVDHLEVLPDEEIQLLKKGNTIPVALPGCSYFLNIDFAPGRKIIDEGLPLVIASDFNPGSAPSFNMSMINSLACSKMKLLPNEAFNASTLNAAFALELDEEVGSITVGKRANFLVGKTGKRINSISYNFGVHWIDQVYVNGKEFTI